MCTKILFIILILLLIIIFLIVFKKNIKYCQTYGKLGACDYYENNCC